MSDLQSRPYRPKAESCCEACVFGMGEHAEHCGYRITRLTRCQLMELSPEDLKRLEILSEDWDTRSVTVRRRR